MSENKDAQAVKQAQSAAAAKGAEQEKSAKEAEELKSKAAEDGKVDAVADPYQDYDYMPLSELVALADERGVTVNPDVLKAHLVTELRAHQSGTRSVSSRRPV